MIENQALLAELRAEFPSTEIFYGKFDITDKNCILITLDRIVETIGNIDVFVNGAGVLWEDRIEETIAINLVSLCFN